MSAVDQPYSPRAARASREAQRTGGGVLEAVEAMHDRKALGPDASVHAASYRAELLRELADSFRPGPVDMEAEDVALFAMETRARIRREVIEEVAAKLRAPLQYDHQTEDGKLAAVAWAGAAEFLLREFEVPHGQ